MNIIKNITNPLERRRLQFGYSQQEISNFLALPNLNILELKKVTQIPTNI